MGGMETTHRLLLCLALLAALGPWTLAAPQQPTPAARPTPGIFAKVDRTEILICGLVGLGAPLQPEDLTSESLVLVPATAQELVVRLSEEARSFGVDQRSLKLVRVRPAEGDPQVVVVATTSSGDVADPMAFALRPVRPLTPGAYQLMVEKLSGDLRASALRFTGCGFRVSPE